MLLGLTFFFLNTVVQATLVLPVERTTGLGCIPDGRTVSYECTVTDASDPVFGSTFWEGSAFNCSSGPFRISLAHFSYESSGERGSCGDLSAMSVGVSGDNYTSRLTLTATAGLNGTTIECSLGGSVLFGSDTLRTGIPLPPPQSPTVDVTSNTSLTVNWTRPSDISNVGGYMLTVTGEDCGCESSMNVDADTISVPCSDWTISDQNCTFEVRTISEDCEFPSNDAVSTSVVISVPSSPRGQLSLGIVQPTCSLESADVILSWMAPLVMAGYPPVQSYRVKVNNGAEMPTTEMSITIPGSTFTRTGTHSFSVKAVNVLGESAPLMADLDVALTSVLSSYSATMMSATLMFSVSNNSCVGSASIIVYYQECANQANCQCPQDTSFSTNEQSTPVTSSFVTIVYNNLRPGVIYCYRSEIINAGFIVGFENGRILTTVPPIPRSFLPLQNAILVNNNTLLYECVNSAEGFNGGSSQIVAVFNSADGSYFVPVCSIFIWLIVLIVILVLVGVVVGVILIVYFVKKHKEDKADDEEDITEFRKTSPTPDSLYADSNTIEHQAAPGTEDQYAMVDRKGKKNTKPKPTPPDALYQDPNTIEHETAASGDTYAVVDKPKRSSKKKGGPDVVPPASEGLTYAEIDLSSKRPKPGSGRQAPQQPGEYPKEHPVEYSSVDHTSQL